MVASRDVTERNRIQQTLRVTERLVSMGALAAGLGHEINNPLSYVVANLQLVANRLPAQAAVVPKPALSVLTEAVDQALEGSERIRVIVRDLQTFARAEGDRSGPIDLHPVIDSCIRIVNHEIRHRARLVRDFGTIPCVYGNQARLGQVFVNLLMNAAHSMDGARAMENELRVITRAGSDETVIVEVHDTGTGVPSKFRGVFLIHFSLPRT